MVGNLGINPFFKEVSSFIELEISNVQAEGILITEKQRIDGDADVPADSCPHTRSLCPSRLSPYLHTGLASTRPFICCNIKVPSTFFIIPHHRHIKTPSGATCPPGYVFSIAGIFCNFVKLEMSLQGAGEK